MASLKGADPFVSAEPEIEVDADTAAAIRQGLRDAKDGRVVSAEEVRKLSPQWISRFSTPKQR
jgi:predicted transcriptional regulator